MRSIYSRLRPAGVLIAASTLHISSKRDEFRAYCADSLPDNFVVNNDETGATVRMKRGWEAKLESGDISYALNWCNTFSVPNELRGKSVCFLVGSTQSGKSTTYQYLAGKKLVVEDKHKHILQARLVESGGVHDQIIGNGSKSKTLLPNIQVLRLDNKSELVLCDMAGFHDSRQAGAALAAIYVTKKCIEAASEARFVVVISELIMYAKAGEELFSDLEMIRKTIPEIAIEKHSVVLLTRSFYRTPIESLGIHVLKSTNGRLLEKWTEDQFVHLPAAGLQKHDSIYSPDTNKSKLSGDLRRSILQIFTTIKPLPRASFASLDYKSALGSGNVTEIETWCRETIVNKQWEDVSISQDMELLKLGVKSMDKYKSLCEESVKAKLDQNKQYGVIKYVSPAMADDIFTSSRSCFFNALNSDIFHKQLNEDFDFLTGKKGQHILTLSAAGGATCGGLAFLACALGFFVTGPILMPVTVVVATGVGGLGAYSTVGGFASDWALKDLLKTVQERPSVKCAALK